MIALCLEYNFAMSRVNINLKVSGWLQILFFGHIAVNQSATQRIECSKCSQYKEELLRNLGR